MMDIHAYKMQPTQSIYIPETNGYKQWQIYKNSISKMHYNLLRLQNDQTQDKHILHVTQDVGKKHVHMKNRKAV